MTPTERAVIAAAEAYVSAVKLMRMGGSMEPSRYWSRIDDLEKAVDALREEGRESLL